MLKFILAILFAIMAVPNSFGQDDETPKPSIKDLDFLIGKWEITFEFYNPRKPGSDVGFREEGTLTCTYDLPSNKGIPKYIVCEGMMKGPNGWNRTFKEFTGYNSFKNTFERTAIFSSWPVILKDQIIFDAENRILDVRGGIEIEDGLFERYQDYYYFDETYSSYERRVVTNFSDMPASEFNQSFISRAKKID